MDHKDFDEKSQIGPYRLRERLGEGGMGVVWLAEQSEPIRRRVALKIIKLGMDTREVIARFESERQALAVMDHPCIAKVLDAGSTEHGRPYFAMELVRGVSIAQYCDQHKLTTRDRVGLIVDVCRAIQHAHQKGVIHRDLKPSNVLVTVGQNEATPKVIDFGIAKAVAGSLTDKTLVTRAGFMLGTPQYMSPEQAEGTELDVDTRTDIYSLGVMLYELLVGALPYETSGGPAAALSIRIRETNVPTPSTRLTGLHGKHEIADARRTTPKGLRRELRGDLDWITMRAMEKDRTRRYSSAAAMADDLERFLNHQAVTARPPSLAYQMGRLWARHKVPLLMTGLAALAMVAGTTAAVVGLVRAQKAEAHALREATAAQQVSDFLVDMFRQASPDRSRGERLTVLEVLRRASPQLEDQLQEQPQIRARLMRTISQVHRNLGLFDEALPLASRAAQLTREGGEAAALAASLSELGSVQTLKGEYEAAQISISEALEVLGYDAAHGDPTTSVAARLAGDPESSSVSDTLGNALMAQGMLHFWQGEHERAGQLLDQAMQVRARTEGELSFAYYEVLSAKGGNLFSKKHYDEAELIFRRAQELIMQIGGPRHPWTAANLNDLAVVENRRGNHEKALEILHQALPISEAVYGREHPDTANLIANMGFELGDLKRWDEAEAKSREALSIREKVYGPDHPRIAASLTDLSVLYAKAERPAEALPLVDRIIEIRGAALGREHPRISQAMTFKASLMLSLERYDEAEALLADALAMMVEARGENDSWLLPMLQNYARLMRATDRDAQAIAFEQRAERISNAAPQAGS